MSLIVTLVTPAKAEADPFCFSFGLYANCVERPDYNIPPPAQQKPIPKWFCSTVYTSTAVLTLIPGVGIATWIARIVFVPTLLCLWN